MENQPNISKSNTLEQFNEVIERARELFLNKTKDYGTSWRSFRMTSLTDQIYIKANRIRTIEQNGDQKINDSIESEFIGILNYCVIALIQKSILDSNENTPLNMDVSGIENSYNFIIKNTIELMETKNHDYGEAWRLIRKTSLTDLILAKLQRLKQIEDNDGTTLVSEGVEGSYYDILNYSVFWLIRNNE